MKLKPTHQGPKIAVHIRQGDYKEWANGIHYYSTEKYRNFINELNHSLKGHASFYIFSDSNLTEADFDIPNLTVSNHSVIEDLDLMSQCDYIVGPPSTFSAWASLYGQTPIFVLHDIKRIPLLSDFKIKTSR